MKRVPHLNVSLGQCLSPDRCCRVRRIYKSMNNVVGWKQMPEMAEYPRLVISTGWVRIPSQTSPQRHEQEMRKREGQFSDGGEVRGCGRVDSNRRGEVKEVGGSCQHLSLARKITFNKTCHNLIYKNKKMMCYSWSSGSLITNEIILYLNLEPPLTGLVGGDVNGDVLCWVRALVANAVDSLDLEAVEGVRQQVADQHPAFGQAQLSWDEVHIVLTVGAGSSVGTALFAHDVVHDVATAARLPGGVPLKDHWGLVDDRDHVPRAGGDACRERERDDSSLAAGKSRHCHAPDCHNKSEAGLQICLQLGSIKSLRSPVINPSAIFEEKLSFPPLFFQHNWNANLFHSHPERSHSETFVSIKHWLFSKMQCSVEYSYPNGSGDSRSRSLPRSPPSKCSLKDVIQSEIKE